jgi:uncharacterized protein YhaN
MIITRIVVEGVGKFGTRSEIVGLGPGVNILAAGNEFGKSTIFKAVRACLFERHNTKNDNVRQLASDGLSLPVTVTIGFDHADSSYTLTKSFIKSPSASLLRGSTEIARNREADEKAWELLGISPGSGRSVDEAAFALLWVGQGQSFKAPEPTGAAANALNTAIQSEVGSLVGGERARVVLAQVKSELGVLLTDSGRPKSGGPLQAAIDQAEARASELTDAESRLALLDRQLNELAEKRGERQRLSDPAELARLQSELKSAEGEVKAGEEAAAIVAALVSTEQHHKVLSDNAAQALTDIVACRDAIEADRKRGSELAEALDPILVQAKIAREEAQKAREEIAALDAEIEKDEELDRTLQRLAKCLARSEGRSTLISRQTALEGFEERLRANRAALAGNAATADVLAASDKIERDLALLSARLEAAASEVLIEIAESGAGKILVDGKAVEGTAAHTAVDPLTISVGDLAVIRIVPPIGAQKGDREKRAGLHGQLSKQLSKTDFASVADLRAARLHRQNLESEASGLQAEAKVLQVEPESVASEIERLKTELAEIDGIVRAELERSSLSELPGAEDISRRQDELRERREDGRRKRRALEGALEAQNGILSSTSAKRAEIDAIKIEVMARLQANLARLPDQDRERLIDTAERGAAAARDEHRQKALALEEQRRTAPTEQELERRTNRVQRLQGALQGQRDRLATLEKQIANLEGQIQSAGGDGLGEKVQALREELALAQREAERTRARAESLTLLRDTIEECYKDQRDRLNAPLRRHLQPFLNDVFPSAELELGDGFAITGIKRQGPSPEDFDRLSAGTQEQIAVLVRLAMGAMLGERGQPVPIILDDALVFSDDDRIEQMFDALTRAGQKQQVIVLTCRTRAFAALGGRPLSISA